MDTYFEAYGTRSEQLNNHTVIAGRYAVQKENERRIVPDVIKKLELQANDRLLEIGCGSGNLLIPISFLVDHGVGIDHPACLKKLTTRARLENIQLIGEDFTKLDIESLGSFNKILVYSVLHCLHCHQDLWIFLNKALQLLSPGGKLLLGDIPNIDLKSRFLKSQEGQQFQSEWNNLITQNQEKEPSFVPVPETIIFDDKLTIQLIARIKDMGYEVYILPQPNNLPFGNTREDILIVKHG